MLAAYKMHTELRSLVYYNLAAMLQPNHYKIHRASN